MKNVKDCNLGDAEYSIIIMFLLVQNQNDQVRNYLTEKMRLQHGANKFH